MVQLQLSSILECSQRIIRRSDERAVLCLEQLQAAILPAKVRHAFWWLGVVATVIGSTLIIVGLILQKDSLHKNASEKKGRLYCTEWRWLLGLCVWFLGQIVCWAADGMANRSLLACFNCWNVVVVFVVAPYFFGEVVVPKALVGAAMTIVGCVWVILTAPKAYYEQTVETLGAGWTSPAFLCIASASLCCILLLGSSSSSRVPWSRRLSFLGSGRYAVVSAVVACYSVLMSKCASSLLVTSVHSDNQLGAWQLWFFLGATILLGVCQVHSLNLAMRDGAATYVLPTYESLSMAGQVLICGVFFGEFRGFALRDVLVFCGGIAAVIIGIVVLMSSTSRHLPNRTLATSSTTD